MCKVHVLHHYISFKWGKAIESWFSGLRSLLPEKKCLTKKNIGILGIFYNYFYFLPKFFRNGHIHSLKSLFSDNFVIFPSYRTYMFEANFFVNHKITFLRPNRVHALICWYFIITFELTYSNYYIHGHIGISLLLRISQILPMVMV